ncbi:golgi complex component [Niveomyces insectorum RCEF 264]|uniref:Golgi complex component n=1 Tax=Niveomyces insectorum RCEF 264 TaxID=1081102 RepID=A0A167N192_9HYPO|nr:golgi complex component [Niveomyces insectorum RCEF 264]
MSSSLTERDDDGRADVAMDGADEDVPELPETVALSSSAEDDRSDNDNGGSGGGGGGPSNNEDAGADAGEDEDDARTIRGDDAAGEIGEPEHGDRGGGREESALDPEPESPTTPVALGNGSAGQRLNHYRAELLEEERQRQQEQDTASEDGSALGLPRRPGSPAGSVVSTADSTASNQRSLVSSIGGSSSAFPSGSSGRFSRLGLRGASPSFRPFDQRFQSRIASGGSTASGLISSSSSSSSNLLSPSRPASPASPAFLALHAAHSRTASSMSSSSYQFQQLEQGSDAPSPPWEVVRWTKLTKLSSQAFSESAKRNFGSPTCMAISASIVLGTTKGILLVFDYNQNLKMIIGPGTKAVEAGAITAVAISADHTTVAGGHADGSIFTWEMSRVARPFLHVPPLDSAPAAHSSQRTTDGHIRNVAVTHLGFLGTRRTALVSADDRGMAFAHLATRGTGSLGRTVKTNRILGRYPGSKPPASGKIIKPSTVLAFAPLPLGNVDRATDSMGLTAMLTPYLLVLVSTTPVANTQHKTPRPKEIAPHSAMSGCLAWFPAVKLRVPDARTHDLVSKAKLVYCWSNVLTVLDVEEQPSEDHDKPPSLHCKARSRWKCEEAIVAVQWLTRSVLAVLTISQRLVVLEDHSMRVTEAFDLLNRYIYHADLFSRQLHGVVEALDDEDSSLHGVVADAFYMSFRAYKGRLFLLGFNDMAIGALSNWADRLIALMEHGDYVGAIQLATSFYAGDADKLTIGLPEDTATRHDMVRARLMEIMAASLKYAFRQRQRNRADADDDHLRELAQACFVACAEVQDTDFLFDEMYGWFEDAGADIEGLFLETLEPYILDQTVTAVPPTAVKALVRHYVGQGLESRLEEMICHMNTATLDLDQITALCKRHSLYDALAYVWNQAMADFITPLIDLLALLVPHMPQGEYEPHHPGTAAGEQDMHDTNALKIFPYLSYVLTGRVYPTGAPMDDATQQQAKSELYWFLFSGQSVVWPRGSSASKRFLTRPHQSQEPSFPYLRMILKFHAPSFLSALNEAFEDSFLNNAPEKQLVNGRSPARRNLPEEQVFGATVDRQYIVSILTEIMNPADFAPDDTIYLDMFIARNLPKYPQYLLLPESTLTNVLRGLCHYPGADLAEDAQLSAEYLLSVYHPADMADLLPQFQEAGFYRILKRTYRADKQYGKLLATYFEDPDDQHGVFACIATCLRTTAAQTGAGSGSGSGSSSNALRRQIQEVYGILKEHAFALVELDPAEAARTLDAHAPALHQHVLASLAHRHDLQYQYLKTLLEDNVDADGDVATAGVTRQGSRHGRQKEQRKNKQQQQQPPEPSDRRDLIEQYIRLLCEFDPAHVSDYVGQVPSADLRLDTLLPTMEATGVVDAAVVLLANDGQVRAAMDRLVAHLHTLEAAVLGLLTSGKAGGGGNGSDSSTSTSENSGGDTHSESGASEGGSDVTVVQRNAAEDLMRALQKYTHVGIWLCQGHTQTRRKAGGGGGSGGDDAVSRLRPQNKDSADLLPDEQLWLDLIDTTVQITRNLSAHILHEEKPKQATGDAGRKNGTAVAPSPAWSSLLPASSQGDKTHPPAPAPQQADGDRLVGLLRSLVQHTFTALLTTTTSSSVAPTVPSPGGRTGDSRASSSSQRNAATAATAATTTNRSFLRILKAFLARAAAASPSLADLRAVLASVFAAYAYEEALLRLANRLLEHSLFGSVQRAVELRQRGWRAKGSTCEACGRRVWGPGVQMQAAPNPGLGQNPNQSQNPSSIYEAWEAKQAAETQRRQEAKRLALLASRGGLDRGKGKDNGHAGSGGGGSSNGPGGGTAENVDYTGKGKGKQKQQQLLLPPTDARPGRAKSPAGRASDGLLFDEDAVGRQSTAATSDTSSSITMTTTPFGPAASTTTLPPPPLGPLVLFACRHIYHQACLDALEAARAAETPGSLRPLPHHGARERDYVCPIDG